MRTITQFILACALPAVAGAQSLAQRVASAEGTVQVVYPSRPSACGDGRSYVGNVFGDSRYYSGNATISGRNNWYERACVHGPARALVTVISGEITRMRVFVGPVPASDIRTLDATAAEASAWLGDIVAHANQRVAEDAMLPLVLVDAPDPWPALMRVARDENRPRGVRSATLTWLSYGVTDKLGISDEHADTDDDEIRKQAVFALSQRPRGESVPELIDVVKNAKNPAARRAAIFWLGQTGDMRAVDVYADLLKLR